MYRKLVAWLILCAAPGGLLHAQATPEEFTVGNIRVEGLQRISEGTVYNYLPVNIGDRLDGRRIQEALRALYATEFFRDVELRRDGNTLVVVVLERPSIESFELKGNKDIKTEDLQKSLRNVGLAQGKTFDRSVLEDVRQFLTDQYFSRGKYAVQIDTKVEDVPDNKVRISIDIKEGKRARIRQINLVGNTRFDADELRDEFELKTPNWLSWYKQDDRYGREALQGDLEKLRSYYMDRGYANFQVESVQVAIAPEKDDIFITINLNEGEVYKVSEVKLAGNMVVPESQLKALLLVQPGQTFSNKLVTASQDLLSYRLGEDGYAFAKIEPVPTADNASKEIALTFVIEPGNRVYVRHINFLGTSSINDDVLRREMRQLEGGWLSNASVERSKERIQRLPYVEKVEFETNPVPGTPDLVDVDYTVKEGLPGQFGGGIGYSESQKFILNGNFVHSNFMGTGQRIAAEINSGKYSKVYSFSHTDPYRTVDGVSRTLSLTYRDITQFVSASSDFSTTTMTAGVDYSYPITEYQALRFGVSAQKAELLTGTGSAQQAIEWVRNNGDRFSASTDDGLGGTIDFFGTRYNVYELITGWSFDTRNRALFADRGTRHQVSLSYSIPGSDVEYWSVSYDYLQFLPIWRQFTLALVGDLGYSEDVGETTAAPPYRQFFAGGPDTVRGYRESRLGPKDNFGNPYGGNLKVSARAELLIPTPEKWRTSTRISFFYDIGNVFSTGHVQFFDKLGQPIDYGFKYDKLKQSTGFAVQWLAPLGIFRFSYAFPLNAYAGDSAIYKDEIERFQFSVGQAF